ncbi:hypothetical protein V1478_011045 [Vespula squamosa]|uniref:Uncharacterized protein n=1 Tax=Vespula squamosa TaxID=30214 RepID=A0ABD2AG44_VESSQ
MGICKVNRSAFRVDRISRQPKRRYTVNASNRAFHNYELCTKAFKARSKSDNSWPLVPRSIYFIGKICEYSNIAKFTYISNRLISILELINSHRAKAGTIIEVNARDIVLAGNGINGTTMARQATARSYYIPYVVSSLF